MDTKGKDALPYRAGYAGGEIQVKGEKVDSKCGEGSLTKILEKNQNAKQTYEDMQKLEAFFSKGSPNELRR